ncbi:hypothetical protein FH972_025008 [Carpinus fangiana]|uniref:non-specific serine/threonine protein kinase n=1 Tax=Carpinus fangiana TaxID=176857 RepID=A0A5N6KZS6_9ROSI|nr:hypothetical protein FH972_025008 [Carpinus fangiana]
MHPNLFPTIALLLVITALSLIHFPSSSYADDEQYLNCSQPFDCAGIKDLSYPFWGSNIRPSYCGHPAFELSCSDDAPLINITFMTYRVLEVENVSRTLTVAREDYWNTLCPATIVNTTINFTVFHYDSATTNLTLYYDCPISTTTNLPQPDTTQFGCSVNDTDVSNYYFNNTVLNSIGNSWGACKYNVNVPVLESVAQPASSDSTALQEAIDGGFLLGWDANNSLCDGCKATGGQCGCSVASMKIVISFSLSVATLMEKKGSSISN